ncbi:SMI1/KNR4 family protein [Sphingobium sp. 3R8]|uniref:SMI1/KNR4 family protein n=1 Tax=Sphingobium sp. 3R8 TaxID=2874921 RepID=UPI001CCD7AC2|nr:SMI1/KNR4 family protein [Sphingobium sp. 3R8]
MPFPVPEQRIVEAERTLGRMLLQRLRHRLMRDNGGDVSVGDDDWSLHPIWDPMDRKTMGRTASHILKETAAARSWSSFPPDGISLASNGSGDRVIICGRGDQLLLWEHETGECRPIASDWL